MKSIITTIRLPAARKAWFIRNRIKVTQTIIDALDRVYPMVKTTPQPRRYVKMPVFKGGKRVS